MKIVKQGNLPFSLSSPLKNWWINHDFRCKKCGCIFRLEASDGIKLSYRVDGLYILSCPWCNTEIGIRNPSEKVLNLPIFEEIFGKNGFFEKIFGKMKI